MEKSSILSSYHHHHHHHHHRHHHSIHQSEMRIPRSTIKSGSDSEDTALVCRNSNRHSSSSYTNQMISRKRETKTEVPFLPEEIIFKIFLLLPAKVLHDVMRTVCRSWRKVIRDPVFVKAHCSCSTTSPFCFFVCDHIFKIYSLKNDGITWKFNKTVNQDYMSHGDGFILTATRDDRSFLYLVNPLTKQTISLPRLRISSTWAFSLNFRVSCSPLTLTYKVVVSKLHTSYILTVGDDKEWREIDLSPETSIQFRTIGHQGFIYWYDPDTDNYLIALDVEKEVFHKVVIPKEVPMKMWEMCSGTSLVVNYCSTSGCREFWELVDCTNGGEWRKFGIVDFDSKKQEIIEIVGLHNSPSVCDYYMKPVVVLSRDVVIFEFDRYFLAYNFKTEQFSRSFDYFRQSSQWELMIDNNLVVL